jgi:hypothetical protein
MFWRFSHLETAGLAATIGAFRSTDEPSQAAVFNGGLPFIVWKPACRRLPWRSKMIKVPDITKSFIVYNAFTTITNLYHQLYAKLI